MTKLFFTPAIFLASALAAGSAYAQPPAASSSGVAASSEARPGVRHRRARRGNVRARLTRMAQHLDLSSDQIARIRTIFESSRERAQAIRSSRRSDTAKRQAMQALRRSTKQRVLAVLTPEQRAELQEHRNTRRNRGDRPARGGHGRRGASASK